MRKSYLLSAILFVFTMGVFAQQDAQFTLFQWATPYYNAGAIGEQSNTLCFTGIFRQQYTGWKDYLYDENGNKTGEYNTSPQQIYFSMESYLRKLHGSLGVAVIKDKIGYFNNANRDEVYRVAFSYVGSGKGNYILSQSVSNGKVYQWVAPLNGLPQGDYEPVVQLNTPKMNDLVAVNASYAISDKLTAMTELAFTYADNNLFSKEGDANNAGIAYKLKLDYRTGLGRRVRDSLWRYRVCLDYEFVHKNYTPLKSFRPVEYYREYNLESDYTSTASEQLTGLTTGFEHAAKGRTLYSFSWLARFGDVSAFRHELASQHKLLNH